MTGIALIIVFFIAIIVMILAISKFKVHPFLAIMGVAVILGLLAGIPIINRDGMTGIVGIVGQGFSAIFTGIGLVIILGTLIGAILEATGGAFKIADMIIRLLGKASPNLAIIIMGWIVSVPVFCDSGFVIINPVRRSIVKRTNASGVATAVGLGAGLYTSHVLVPLTPGPLAASYYLGLGDQLLLVIGVSVVISIPSLIAAYFWSTWRGKKEKSKEDLEIAKNETVKSYDELVKSFGGKLPNGLLSLAPIIIPIICMAIGSVATFMEWGGPEGLVFFNNGITIGSFTLFGNGFMFGDIMLFIGLPLVALTIGLIFAIILLAVSKKMPAFNGLTNDTLKMLGPILFITGAGGVLGRVIAVSDMVPFIEYHAENLMWMGLFLPFVVSALIKTAQGSSTVAIMVTAGVMMPIMGVLGLDSAIMTALTVMAIGAGSMMASHANDSYFWVVTNLSEMTPQQGYKNWTSMTVIQGVACMLGIFVFSLFVS